MLLNIFKNSSVISLDKDEHFSICFTNNLQQFPKHMIWKEPKSVKIFLGTYKVLEQRDWAEVSYKINCWPKKTGKAQRLQFLYRNGNDSYSHIVSWGEKENSYSIS